jgi:hypothetical protein
VNNVVSAHAMKTYWGHFTPDKEPMVPIQQKVGWAHSRSGHFGKDKSCLPTAGMELHLFDSKPVAQH